MKGLCPYPVAEVTENKQGTCFQSRWGWWEHLCAAAFLRFWEN